MPKKILSLLFLLVGVLTIKMAGAQGCSDAGFCTAGAIKPASSNFSQFQNSLGFSFGYALGERGTSIYTPQFEPNIKLSHKSMVQIKIPFVFIQGNVTSLRGMGDVILTYNRLLDSNLKWPIILTLGTRVATGTASAKSANIPLPMPYQISLGTTDLILSIKIGMPKGFSISFGYQQPILNGNQNGFDSTAFKELGKAQSIPSDENFFISSGLKRKGDLMLRIDKSFKRPKTLYSIGALPIYHLGKDKVILGNNHESTLKGSEGLTLNVNASVIHKLSANLELSVIAAVPLIVRKSRPDGLTRAFVSLVGLRYYL